jgi:zinc protease
MLIVQKLLARTCVLGAGLFLSVQSAWALIPIQHWAEANGAQVWLVESPAIPMVDVQIRFDAGQRRDPAQQAGLAPAVANMASKGVRAVGDAPALDENALGEAWADLGASLSISASEDAFDVALRSLTAPDLLDKAAQLAARQLAEPAWPQDIWQRERQRWSAALREARTRPATIAQEAFEQAVYGSHPYGYRVTDETLERIQVADMAQFHVQYLQACRARVHIVGALNKGQAQALVHTLLARLPASKDCAPLPAVPEVAALTQAQEQKIALASAQAHILLGQPSMPRSDPDFLPLLVGNHILGGGGFVSRLMQEVREKRGLSYSVYSSFAPGLHAGAFVVGLQTRPDQAEQALQVARDVVARFVAQGPTEAELRAAKDNLIGGFALRIDSNQKLLGNVVNIASHGLPLDYLEHWRTKVQAITSADIKAAMQRKLQPARMATIIVGGQQP